MLGCWFLVLYFRKKIVLSKRRNDEIYQISAAEVSVMCFRIFKIIKVIIYPEFYLVFCRAVRSICKCVLWNNTSLAIAAAASQEQEKEIIIIRTLRYSNSLSSVKATLHNKHPDLWLSSSQQETSTEHVLHHSLEVSRRPQFRLAHPFSDWWQKSSIFVYFLSLNCY